MAGQIIKRGENTWLVRVFLGRGQDGNRDYFSKTIHGTKKDAQRFLTAKLREKDLGTFVDHADEHLNEFLDRWLADVVKEKVSAKTFESYHWILNAYIRPSLGKRRLIQIKPPEVQKLYTEMRTRVYRPEP